MRTATGSALISVGETRVICTASAQESVPRWMTGQGRGWVTAEYGMLPASTGERKQRDVTRGRQDGRTVEIQRLIGRSLRGRDRLRRRSANARSTSTATCCRPTAARAARRSPAPTWRWRWPARACSAEGQLERSPLTGSVAAVSCGMIDGAALLDLDYSEDSTAEVDANVVMTGDGGLVEVQATAERTPLSRAHLDELLALAADGIEQLRAIQAAGDRATALSRARVRAGRPLKLLLATHNEHKRREFARLLGGRRPGCDRARGAARRGRAAARGRRDVRRERARQGARGGAGDGRVEHRR